MTDSALTKLVFMLEEESAKQLLKVLWPKILPASSVKPLYIAHKGKSDLRKSIPIKLKAWNVPDTLFVILHDQDSHPDCKILKNDLRELCASSKHTPLIRIACRELEAWYFGDLNAVQQAFPGFSATKYKNRAQFRNPDDIVNPSYELKRIIGDFDKGRASREVPKYMDIDNNGSVSFNRTINGIKNLVAAQLSAQKS